MKKIFAFTAVLAVCLTVTSCGGNNSLPEDTSAIEQYIEQASETTREEVATTVTTEETTAETTPFEDLSDYDKAIRLAAEHIEEHGADHWEYILYDFDLDGIPELMEETGFMDIWAGISISLQAVKRQIWDIWNLREQMKYFLIRDIITVTS